ncbi:TadE family protein [Sphingomonas aracearum]|uniref:Pilus assembly protein n=1 Tax=Sphingomonas aracearum TaxID=2283317 RepID=A0A369VTK8_9SPHN|nr:TadE family protein [Sphingomonas aracearum]RDE05179.1 pilus assembly protein [Sphingomonas aracearum]
MRNGLPRRLRRDRRGVTVVEFAIVAPVLCLFLVGAFDIAHTLYLQTALEGVVQKAARDATLESGNTVTQQNVIDATVTRQVRELASNVTPQFKRRFYRTFSEAAAATPEDWDDTNGNGTCDAGERYGDANGNMVWDADGGNAGQGGAKDATLYTVSLTFTPFFPLWKMLKRVGWKNSVSATTILRNQPYNDQDSYGATVWRNC